MPILTPQLAFLIETTLENELFIESLEQKGVRVAELNNFEEYISIREEQETFLVLDAKMIGEIFKRCIEAHFEHNNSSEFNEKLLKACKSNETLSLENQQLCYYLKRGMSNNEISRLLNIQENSVKRSQTRVKNKLNVPKGLTLRKFVNTL